MTNRKKRSIDRSHRIEVRLTDEEYKELEQLAYEEDTSISAVVRRAIKRLAENARR